MVPMLALIAFYAPPARRGTWFAVGASFMNLGLAGANLLMKYLNIIFEVKRAVVDAEGVVTTEADYSRLGLLILAKIAVSFVVPMIAVFVFLRKPGKPTEPTGTDTDSRPTGTDTDSSAPLPQAAPTGTDDDSPPVADPDPQEEKQGGV
jgi:hypothetical protein